MNDIDIAIVNWSEKQTEITSVRRAVFVEEQNVPESIDFDGSDIDYIHVLATDKNGRPIGTARINRKAGKAAPAGHIFDLGERTDGRLMCARQKYRV